MTHELEILKLVCNKLDLVDIPYMLTGSFAANFYAVPRMTRDIDIVIEIHQKDINKLIQIFKDDFYIERDSISEAIKYQSMFNIIHNNSVLKVDFIILKDATYRDLEFQRRRQVQFNDISLWIVSPEDLIISKLFWAKDSFSQMQLNDVKNLLASIKQLDHLYINKWVKILELKEIYERVTC
jgi:hypothetical protein